MKTFRILWGMAILLFPGLLYAQTLTVKGVIADQAGNTLPGVTISVKNEPGGVMSGLEGDYSIKAAKGQTLVFSCIGFLTREHLLAEEQTLNITLQEENLRLDEVVVTAMGIRQQKKKLGYATQQISGETLPQSQTMNIGNALSGQVAGLTVANRTGMFQAPSISLRGKEPLIVIDGIPVTTDFFDLNAEDVESMNVLKGPTASALYGSRGKNGAILVTTKTAKKEGLEVNISTTNMMTAGFTVFPEAQSEYGSGSNYRYEFWDGADGGISDGDMTWGPKLDAGLKIAQWNSPIRNKQTGETIPWWGDVSGTVYDNKSLYERVPIDFVSHDNLADFLRTGVVTNNNFSVAYKGARANYYMSGKYARQEGQVPNTSLNSGGLNFNTSIELSQNVQFEASMSYNRVYSPNYPRYGYGPKNHMYTILIWMSDDVNGRELAKHLYVPGQEGYRQANYNYAWYNNPYFASYELQQMKDMNVSDIKARLNWQILPNLSLLGRAALRETKSYENMQSPKSYMNYGDSRNGDFKVWDTGTENIDADLMASYFQPVASKINLSINAGTAVHHNRYRQEYQSTDGLIVPQLYSLNNTMGPVMASNDFNQKQIRSVYGTAGLDFFESVFLNVTARNDWSSTLPSSNNSYFYPSVSLSTLVSEYVRTPKAIDFLKLYGSWVQVSSDLSPYSTYSTYSKDVTYGSTQSVSYPSGIINPDIKPEMSISYEFGLSTSFLKNRLMLDMSYYRIIDENQIIDLSISEASGFSTRKVNGNQYTTDGLEVVIGAQPVIGKNFRWNLSANWSHAVKRLTEIYGGQKRYGDLKLGERADSYYGTVWQKSADGQLILDANNVLPTRDPFRANLGHTGPDWRLGLQNAFHIKDFVVGIDIDGAWGGVMRSLTTEKMWWGGRHPESVEFRAAEIAANAPVYVPNGVVVTGGELIRDVEGNVLSDTRTYTPNTQAVSWQTWCQIYPYQANVVYTDNKKFANIFDRTYLKLRRLSIGYDLAKLVDMGRIKSCNVSLFGNNLLMWKNIPYVDPDYGDDDNLQDPSARYAGVSLNVKL